MFKCYVNISIQSSVVSQQLQKKKLVGLGNCTAGLKRTFSKKFSKSNRGSAPPKPKQCSDRSVFSVSCVKTSLKNTGMWKIIVFTVASYKFIRQTFCFHTKQNPALTRMARAPDHVNHLKIAIGPSSLSHSTDQLCTRRRSGQQLNTPPETPKENQGIFLIPIT